MGNIIGPYFIHYDSMISGHNESRSPEDEEVTSLEMRLKISWYLAAQAFLLFSLFLAILIYFPSKPKVKYFWNTILGGCKTILHQFLISNICVTLLPLFFYRRLQLLRRQ